MQERFGALFFANGKCHASENRSSRPYINAGMHLRTGSCPVMARSLGIAAGDKIFTKLQFLVEPRALGTLPALVHGKFFNQGVFS